MNNKGFVTLMSMLIVVAVGTLVSVSLLLLGLAASRNSFSVEQSKQAQSLVDACAEEALQQIRDDNNYTGSNTLSLGQGSCSYTVTNGGGSNRSITVSATVGEVVRKASVNIDALNPNINISLWQEVADL